MRVYLDNCCYNRPFDPQNQMKIKLESEAKLRIQDLIIQGEIELASSYMSLYECSKNPNPTRRDSIREYINKHTTKYVSPDNHKTVASKAKEIMETGIKYKDAIHIAAAIYAECDVFLSTDIRALKYKTDEIRLMNPVEFFIGEDDNTVLGEEVTN